MLKIKRWICFFQCKLLHGNTYTNHHLYRFEIAQSNICWFCKEEEKTLLSLFFKCEKVRLIWNDCNNIFDLISIPNLSWEAGTAERLTHWERHQQKWAICGRRAPTKGNHKVYISFLFRHWDIFLHFHDCSDYIIMDDINIFSLFTWYITLCSAWSVMVWILICEASDVR